MDRINTDERLADLRTGKDATKRSGIPVGILFLACLRLLGRYPHYEDIEEICGVSDSTIARYFKKFVHLYVLTGGLS